MDSNAALRFIAADRVDTPAGRLNDFTVVSPTDAQLGTVDGVIVDPSQRQVRYYIVKAPGWVFCHRYLLPATPAHLEAERRTLQIDIEPAELIGFPEADAKSFSRFSADDAVEAIFAKRLD
ncbi:MAG: PRC-barrel domain-containing protein [Vicinamibacterales bacterium]